ncbi:MAG: HAD-IA family hydrolase [Bryobacterales bacterium]|nr:HAD-IA family hydrolase [Bryobacterales bacterium]
MRAPVVFFDIGSTLIEGPAAGPARRFAQTLGLDASAAAVIRDFLFRTDLKDAAELARFLSSRFPVDAARALEAAAALWQMQRQEAFVLPGAAGAIARLKSAGIQRGYISNIWPPFFERFHCEFREEAERQPCFVSFRTGLLKPDPEVYRRALQACGLQAGEAVMVGDTYLNDIAPAIEAGMHTVWLLHRPGKESSDLVRVLNGAAPAPDLTLESIAQLEPRAVLDLVAAR